MGVLFDLHAYRFQELLVRKEAEGAQNSPWGSIHPHVIIFIFLNGYNAKNKRSHWFSFFWYI